MKKLSIIIPVYYNEGSLSQLFIELLEIEKQLIEKDLQLELIFVDDGSGDNSLRELLKMKEQRQETIIIKLSRNFGSFHALKVGFQHATGDCFTTLSADLQDPPKLIIQMVEKWRQGSKFVICSRSDRHDPMATKIWASIYYKLIKAFVFKDYPSGGYDFALMDRALLPYLQNSGKNINSPLFAYWLGFNPDVINYERQKRAHGKSRWTFSKKATLFLDSLLGFSIVPIRFISAIGIVISLISFSYTIFIIINALLGRMPVQGFATVASLISFLLGLIIIMLGVIGEYLWRIFDEVNKRPESVIDKIY